MNYQVIGKEQKLFGPYTVERLSAFAEAGKLRGNMILVDENGSKIYASNVVPSLMDHPTHGLNVPGETPTATNVTNTSSDDYVVIEPDDSPTPTTVSNSNSYVEITPDPITPKEPVWTMIGADGNSYGPYTKAELTSFISENRITPNTILTDEYGRQSQANSILSFGYQSQSYGNQGYGATSNYGGQYGAGQGYGRPNYVGNDSGTGTGAVLPLELRGLNWGAFFLHWIWGIPNKTYLAFLWFAIGWIMCFVLLFKGNEWAWQNRRFSSVEEFKEIQRQWTIWGIICFVFLELPAIIFFVIVPFIAMIGGMASSF